MGTSTTNDQVLHLELDLTVPEVIDLQVQRSYSGFIRRGCSFATSGAGVRAEVGG